MTLPPAKTVNCFKGCKLYAYFKFYALAQYPVRHHYVPMECSRHSYFHCGKVSPQEGSVKCRDGKRGNTCLPILLFADVGLGPCEVSRLDEKEVLEFWGLQDSPKLELLCVCGQEFGGAEVAPLGASGIPLDLHPHTRYSGRKFEEEFLISELLGHL